MGAPFSEIPGNVSCASGRWRGTGKGEEEGRDGAVIWFDPAGFLVRKLKAEHVSSGANGRSIPEMFWPPIQCFPVFMT